MLATVLLLRKRDDTVAAGLSLGLPVSLIADRLEHEMRGGIAELRALSRDSGLLRLRAEALSLDLELSLRRDAHFASITKDLIRGHVSGDSYAARWYRHADGETAAEAAAKANSETVGSVRRIAVTESSESFNSGRLEAARSAGLDLYRRWDAQADACPVCGDQDGIVVGVSESFPEGEPGAVHPNCCCDWELISAAEAGVSAAA